MAQFTPKIPAREIHSTQPSVSGRAPATLMVKSHSSLSGNQLTRAKAEGGSPLKTPTGLRLDVEKSPLENNGNKLFLGLSPGAKPGSKIQSVLKSLSEASNTPQTENEGFKAASPASSGGDGATPPLRSTRRMQEIPKGNWPNQAPNLDVCTKLGVKAVQLKLQQTLAAQRERADSQLAAMKESRDQTVKKKAGIPNQRPLPTAIGPRPLKPKRPPSVRLNKYRREAETHPSPCPVQLAGQLQIAPLIRVPPLPTLQGRHSVDSMLEELEHNEYDDVEPVGVMSRNQKLHCNPPPTPPPKRNNKIGEDVYDDVDIPDEFPPPPPDISLPSIIKAEKQSKKKMEKEEREFRKRFKYEGEIKVLALVVVDPKTGVRKGGGKNLLVRPGEMLEVIEFTNERQAICRNSEGKYGFAPRLVLLHRDYEIYDDIDSPDCTITGD
ncbi:FYN-binding protein 1 [Callorhinchus milii]|uniref:Helically-extended SH3 domain-containing protein n=1 Tax=Callorhinchus milii TaxID=7868 RepID=A0A4W3KC30_CALMI|nr:FYN-binding protein 1 [Callorhinchus milii]|eukprot:gi/632966024/ref/XP_007899189.1/ PREDICTED: PML-RARA-regulated adapter molecule 1 [Callorhinchus milii]